jgi:hypothetical protein
MINLKIPTIVIDGALGIFDKRRPSFGFKKLFKRIHDSENFALVALDYPILQNCKNKGRPSNPPKNAEEVKMEYASDRRNRQHGK